MAKRVFLLAVAVVLLVPQWAGGLQNCGCIVADTCIVTCPAGDIPFSVFLYSDSACKVPVVDFDCLRLDFSGFGTSMAVCPEGEPDRPYVFPDAPTDSRGEARFTIAWKGCSSALPAYLEVCGCPDTEIACVKSLDIDMNGWVGGDDVTYCESMMGTDECCCDFDCDGVVDADDVEIIRAHLLHYCGSSPDCETALLSPADGATCVGTDVVLNWSDATAATGYEVQLGTTCGSGTTYTASGSGMSVAGLEEGATYYWRSRPQCDGAWGAWSACNEFSTAPAPPGVPTLVSPPDGQRDLPTTVTLVWDCVSGAEGYQVQMGDGCGGGTTSSTTSCSEELVGLDYYTEYCWRVKAEGECGNASDWSDCRCFRTAPAPPPPNGSGKWALHFAGPHNAKTNTCGFSPVGCGDISVDAPAGPGRYDVYVVAVDVDGIAGTRYGLACDGPFYFYGWKSCSDLEIPSDGWPGCAEGNAQVWSLEQAGPHVAVGILDVYCYGSSVSLSAAPDPRVDFAEWCDGTQPSPQCLEVTNPKAFGSIGFGVSGYNPCSTVPVALERFVTSAGWEGILLEWSAAEEIGFSSFFVYRSALGREGEYLRLHEEPICGGGAGGGEYSYLDTGVVPGTLYYYKLEGTRPGGTSAFFGPYPVQAAAARADYGLYQNFPNPFGRGTATTISYSLARPGDVRIRILDAAGRLVNTLESRGRSGINSVTWDGTDGQGRKLASGVYFYEIEAGGFTGERKMLMVE